MKFLAAIIKKIVPFAYYALMAERMLRKESVFQYGHMKKLDFENQFLQCLKDYGYAGKSKLYLHCLKVDVLTVLLSYEFEPSEYFLYDFVHKGCIIRKTFMSEYYKNRLLDSVYGDNATKLFAELKDKNVFYQKAKPYFKRETCPITSDSDFVVFHDFVKKHQSFFVKNADGSCGIGAHIETCETDKEIKQTFDKLLSMGKWIAEELVVQVPEMAIWNDSSVNTVRIPSFMTSNGVVVFFSLFRTGRKGNVVDNCHGNGGLFANPNDLTGIIETEGYDVYGFTHKQHDDSKVVFKGWQIPKWEELLIFNKEIHENILPDHKYVGFDYALTEKGWVLIEADWGDMPHQCACKIGIKRRFESLLYA